MSLGVSKRGVQRLMAPENYEQLFRRLTRIVANGLVITTVAVYSNSLDR